MAFKDLGVVPYPQEMKILPGRLLIDSNPVLVGSTAADGKERLALASLQAALEHLPAKDGDDARVEIRVGSASTIKNVGQWLRKEEIIRLEDISDQGYFLKVERQSVTVVGKAPIGTLYGAQTLVQILRHRRKGREYRIPCLEILDYPSTEKRFLAPAMAWYAGYGRIGFSMQLWGWEQWKWFVDWCLEHKVNGLNLCIYGYYPFRFDEYPESVLKDVALKTWIREVGDEMTVRYTHPNVENEFLPRLIGYANERGIEVYCYFGLNTFNGGYAMAHPESRYFSKDPDRLRQFKYNLCPSRDDALNYLKRSVRKLMEIGFNGVVFEESEGSVFCECDQCRRRYYGSENDPRMALHRASYDLIKIFHRVMKDARPDAVLGVRMWRQGAELGPEYLKDQQSLVPPDTLAFWSNGIDYKRFIGWVQALSPERIIGQDAESLAWAPTYGRLIFLVPEQFSNYVSFVDSSYEPSFPQNLWNDIRQYQQAARHHCKGVTGYAFEWYGWEIAPLSLAQYGWNPSPPFEPEGFVEYGYRHLFGKKIGHMIAESALNLPIVLESRICEDVVKPVPRDDPAREGLGNIMTLSIPAMFGEGKGEMKALTADLHRAQKSLTTVRKARRQFRGDPHYLKSLESLENAAERTIRICKAGIFYRRALQLEKAKKPRPDRISRCLRLALENAEDNYRIIRENSFDLTEEFFLRTHRSIDIIRRRLGDCMRVRA
jgi:hypothetical protein